MQTFEMTRYRLPNEAQDEFEHVGEATVYLASEVDTELAKLKEALHTLYGQVDQAREGFGIYAASNTMDAAMAAAKEVLKL